MKIDETYQNIHLLDTARETEASRGHEKGSPKEAKPEHVKNGETEVELSITSREVMKAREAIDKSDPARAARVEELRLKVAEGTYEADPGELAGKMLEAALLELL